MASVLGELHFTRCGNEITINCHQKEEVCIKIGESIWLVLTWKQAETLRDRLIKKLTD